jgi:diaminopropionate ammonia-lyase
MSVDLFAPQKIDKARTFHRSFQEYSETPLHRLDNLAEMLGVGGIFVKDESFRFGLNAFKVLGASFAIAQYLAKRLGTDVDHFDFSALTSPEIRKRLGDITFVAATDGNHGHGVAWTARKLNQRAVVYMPKGSSLARLERIRAEGATAFITDLNYDETVRLSNEEARKNHWVIVQDTAWDGYEEIPAWIMQGYGTLAMEAQEQIGQYGLKKPTHIFIQAGVGSLAATVQGYFASIFGDDRPKTIIVEPNSADCFYRSVTANDEKSRCVTGDLATIMAGLACGEPNPLGWGILRDYCDMFVSCPDWVSAKGMRILANPLGNDPCIISGESGAVTAGLLASLMHEESLREARKILELGESSQVLLISTEGATDPEKYRRIVWDGEYPSVWSA